MHHLRPALAFLAGALLTASALTWACNPPAPFYDGADLKLESVEIDGAASAAPAGSFRLDPDANAPGTLYTLRVYDPERHADRAFVVRS